MSTHKDQRYLVALCQGEAAVVDEIYERFAHQARNWIVNRNGTLADAQDIFQDALIAVLAKACDPDFKLPCAFGAYLMGIIRNKWFDKIKKENRETEVRKVQKELYDNIETNIADLISQTEEEEARQKILSQSFQQLSDLCRQLLDMLIVKNLKPAIVAERLSMSGANAVYRRKNACLERWRKLYYSSNS